MCVASGSNSFLGGMWWILILLVLVLLVGFGYLKLLRRITPTAAHSETAV